jgi:hypothetical protein
VISVPGNGNGLVRIPESEVCEDSWLKLPRYAPEKGYDLTRVVYTMGNQQGSGEQRTGSLNAHSLFVRVRTEMGKDGRIEKSLFGKLAGPIEYSVHNTVSLGLRLSHYLNPTPNDRNMEFDIRHNLLKNLSRLEQVDSP